MNCIFCCVFNQSKYVEMFCLLLESILIYGNLDNNTHILVYTSTEFMNMIKNNYLFDKDRIVFEINDGYNDVEKSCKARLDLYLLPSVSNYDKILYLDTDIIVKGDLNKVFDICEEDLLYVLPEGDIISNTDWWGNVLFGDEVNNYEDKTAFNSGILLFNNCEKLRLLFENINKDMVNRPYNFVCHDQPYIVYNAFKYNMFNSKVLTPFAICHDCDINSDKLIHHFPGGPGHYKDKLCKMETFLNGLKSIHNTWNQTDLVKSEYESKRSEMNIYLEDLRNIIIECNMPLEGNCFYHHMTLDVFSELYSKQVNLFWCG